MKRMVALFLALALVLSLGAGLAAAAYSVPAYEDGPTLTPASKCPAQPTVYSSPRYLDPRNNTGYDLRGGLSAKKINTDTSGREYGLYFKFTPKRADDGYEIRRFDVVVTNKAGEVLYVDGFDGYMDCQYRYYWCWNFFPLEGLFSGLRDRYGEVVSGRYTMDIYFNSLWAGKTAFSIGK